MTEGRRTTPAPAPAEDTVAVLSSTVVVEELVMVAVEVEGGRVDFED